MSIDHEWLNLIEVSGPFLAVPVLREVFPQGLDEIGGSKRLRSAYEEWRDAVDAEDPDLGALHQAWVAEVLRTALDADDTLVRRGARIPASTVTTLLEHDTTISPDLVVVDPTHADTALAIVHLFPPDTDLSASMKFGGLTCGAADRMAIHLRAIGLPVGLVTNGERWMLVHAPAGRVATFASWYARIWGQEPQSLRAFASLLSVRRLFGPAQDRLPSLFERSLKHQDEVTDALGLQVRRAIEVLVQALDRADLDRNRELLRNVEPRALYEAGLTVMMRLVFLLAAEERGLLLLGDPRYDAFYAISTLRRQLLEDSDEILERRRSAWSRLLAVFRGVYGGIDHPTLRLAAMGGSLFDPDRFPFLEGRSTGTSWRQDRAEPLPIDDRTVLLLLDAIQTFDGRTLSYRALDVEQVGHVYEGLLERTVTRVEDVTLELEGSGQAKEPRLTLGELESARLDGLEAAVNLVVERSKRSESATRNALAADAVSDQGARLLAACRGDTALRDRVQPYLRLLRVDPWGYPLVYPRGAFVVALGSDRRETGTHYTPKSLTERIVEETLMPLVYDGPADGKPRAEWTLRTPAEILDLKVCDPAMGSGAFLVQTCRFLGDRLVESWAAEEAKGRVVDVAGRVHDARSPLEPLPPGTETRAEHGRRIIAERCLYGVDLNPLAVELAKLSLWLVTFSKGRPFGFLDHNLRSGDALLGIGRLGQLTELRMNPSGERAARPFVVAVERAVAEAVALQDKLHAIATLDVRDVEAKAALDREARKKLNVLKLVADAFVGAVLTAEGSEALEDRRAELADDADRILKGNVRAVEVVSRSGAADLSRDSTTGPRRPFHWSLEFPEVFLRDKDGFDAFIGNPPFLGGRKIRGALGGAYLQYLTSHFGENASGNADYCAFFFLRAFDLCARDGNCGFLATNSIAEGDTRKTGLQYLTQKGARIFHAQDDHPWPGTASVTVAIVVFSKVATRTPAVLGGAAVRSITASLKTEEVAEKARSLRSNENLCFQGSVLAAKGFIVTPAQARALLQADPKNADVVFPYFTGEEIFNSVELRPSRFVINFFDWPRERAATYAEPFRILEETVRPVRAKVNRKAHREYWWHFGDKRPALYARLAKVKHAIIQSRNAKYLSPQFVATGPVFSEQTVIFPVDETWLIGVLNSAIHECWVRETTSSLGTGMRYAHTDCFYTFPLPAAEARAAISDSAAAVERARTACRSQYGLSVNTLLDAFHDSARSERELLDLRMLKIRLDEAVARAYGWGDLALDHDFRELPTLPENDRTRFTMSERARVEVLRRLSDLNRRRYDAEVASGLHGSPGSSKGRRKRSEDDGSNE